MKKRKTLKEKNPKNIKHVFCKLDFCFKLKRKRKRKKTGMKWQIETVTCASALCVVIKLLNSKTF